MSNNLGNIFKDTADSIRVKLRSQEKMRPDVFDDKILEIPEQIIPDIYKVATIAERDALEAKLGDMCIVTHKLEEPLTVQFTGGTIKLVNVVVLDEAITGSYTCYIRSNNVNITCRLNQTSMNISYMDDISGEYSQITYIGSDGINYTKVTGIDSFEISNPTFMSYNDNFSKFFTALDFSFDGIFIYETNTLGETEWSNYYLGTSALSSDILLNKTAYTSSGMLSGTRDLADYWPIKYAIQDIAPEDTSKLWVKLKDPSYYSIFNKYNKSYTSRPDNPVYMNIISKDTLNKNNIRFYKYIDGLTGTSHARYTIGDYVYIFDSGNMKKLNLNDFSVTTCASLPNNLTSYLHTTTDGERYIYFLYGTTSATSSATNTYLYRYDVTDNSYTRLAALPDSSIKNSSCGVCYSHKLNKVLASYYTSDYSSANRKFCIYDINTNSWSRGSNNLASVPSTDNCIINLFEDYYCSYSKLGGSFSVYKETDNYNEPFKSVNLKVKWTTSQSVIPQLLYGCPILKLDDGFISYGSEGLLNYVKYSEEKTDSDGNILVERVSVLPLTNIVSRDLSYVGSRYDIENKELYLVVQGAESSSYLYNRNDAVIKILNFSTEGTEIRTRDAIKFVLGKNYVDPIQILTGMYNNIANVILNFYDTSSFNSGLIDSRPKNAVKEVYKYYNDTWNKIVDCDEYSASVVDEYITKPEQTKTLLPSTIPQTVTPDEGYTLSSVTVDAVNNTIDSNIKAENIKSGVTILGITGSYNGTPKLEQSKTATPATSQQVVIPDEGYVLSSVIINPVTNSIDEDIKAENIRYGVDILGVTGTYTDNAKPEQSKTATPATHLQTVIPDEGYTLSSVIINPVTSAVDEDIKAENIKEGVVILDVQGNYAGADLQLQSKTATPATSQQIITPDEGYMLDKVTINAVTNSIDEDITSGNIKKNVNILGVTGSYEGSSSTGNVVYLAYSGSTSYTPYFYIWNPPSDEYLPWPGAAMSKTNKTYNGYPIYAGAFTKDKNYSCVVFSNGTSQTADLDLQLGRLYDMRSNNWVDMI